jgi:hypothetical protein
MSLIIYWPEDGQQYYHKVLYTQNWNCVKDYTKFYFCKMWYEISYCHYYYSILPTPTLHCMSLPKMQAAYSSETLLPRPYVILT